VSRGFLGRGGARRREAAPVIRAVGLLVVGALFLVVFVSVMAWHGLVGFGVGAGWEFVVRLVVGGIGLFVLYTAMVTLRSVWRGRVERSGAGSAVGLRVVRGVGGSSTSSVGERSPSRWFADPPVARDVRPEGAVAVSSPRADGVTESPGVLLDEDQAAIELAAAQTKTDALLVAWAALGVAEPGTSDVMPAVRWLAAHGVVVSRSRAYDTRRRVVTRRRAVGQSVAGGGVR
jgi:hypothetical protein